MIYSMSYTDTIILCGLLLASCSFFTIIPAHAFTANSLDITVVENGDAIATFRFTLEGFIENAIPQSMLEEELTKGLTTSSDPPVLQSMDRSSAVLLLKKFADTSDVPTGKEYRTATMDFKKAEIALQNSGLGDAVTADFSPATVSLTFPDAYKRQFSNVDVLPAVFHTIEDPVKVAQVRAQAEAAAQAQALPGATTPSTITSTAAKGSVNVTSSPQNVKVSMDSQYIGEAPALFQDIPAGTHVMEFTKDGYSPVRKNVLVNAGKTTNIMVALTYIPGAVTPEEPSSFPWLPVLLVITGLIVIGIGGYYSWCEKTRKDNGVNAIRNRNAGTADSRKPITEKIVISQPTIKDEDSLKGSTGIAATKPVADKMALDHLKITTDDVLNGSAGVVDHEKTVTETIVIDLPKITTENSRNGSTGVAETRKIVTEKTVRKKQKNKADDIRKEGAGTADTKKPDTGNTTVKHQESGDDDTGDECR
jgi:phage tail protein X